MQAADYPEVPDDFGHWLAGFIDGEGHFSIQRNKYASRSTVSFSPRFVIKLRDDDSWILGEVQRRLGFGVVRRYPARPPTRAIVQWEVTSKAECARLVELLDGFRLRAKKSQDYAIWREAVLHWLKLAPRQRGGRYGAQPEPYDWGPIPLLRGELMRKRSYDPPPLPPLPVLPPTLWED